MPCFKVLRIISLFQVNRVILLTPIPSKKCCGSRYYPSPTLVQPKPEVEKSDKPISLTFALLCLKIVVFISVYLYVLGNMLALLHDEILVGKKVCLLKICNTTVPD